MNRKAKAVLFVTLILVGILFVSVAIAKRGGGGKPKPACNDKIDNDNDGLVDLADPGCNNRKDNDEYNAPPEYCGDAICNTAETCNSCPGDCGVCPPVCGDGECNGNETCITCETDCGVCSDSCSDTDDGIVEWIQGIVSGYSSGQYYELTDHCLEANNTIVEYYCNGEWPAVTSYTCDFSNSTCVDGACI